MFLNEKMKQHVITLKDVRWEITCLLSALKVAKAPMRLISGPSRVLESASRTGGTLLFAYQIASRGSRKSVSALEINIRAFGQP